MVSRLWTLARRECICALVLLVYPVETNAVDYSKRYAEYYHGTAQEPSFQVQDVDASENEERRSESGTGWTIAAVVDLLATITIAVFSVLLWVVTKKAAEAAMTSAKAAMTSAKAAMTSAETATADYRLARRSDVYLKWWPAALRDNVWMLRCDVKANTVTTIKYVEITYAFSRSGEPFYRHEPPAEGQASPHRSVHVHAPVSGPQDPDNLVVDVKVSYVDAASEREDSVTFRRCYTRIEGATYRVGDRWDEGDKEGLQTY